MEKAAYFAGGCFWCITPVFKLQKGVLSVKSGYCGGDLPYPSYEQVKSGATGHRETVRVIYDDEQISYKTLLKIFLLNVDPFDGGGQFIDRGSSYTLAIFFEEDADKEEALAALASLERETGKKPQIALLPFRAFYEAEAYHQDYYAKHPKEFEEEMVRSGRKKE